MVEAGSRRVAREATASRKGLSLVRLLYGGRKVGLYRVEGVREGSLMVSHGGISFPIGTELVVEDVHGVVSRASSTALATRVVENDARGMCLAW